MKKRLLSLFLTFSMLLTFFPVGTVTVFASDSPMAYTDGFYQFILNADNTATITKYTGNEQMLFYSLTRSNLSLSISTIWGKKSLPPQKQAGIP